MDQIKQRTAIAEYLGYIDVREYVVDMDNDYLSLMGRKYKKGPLIRIPDYLNDLNAMHEVETHLLNKEGDDWGIYCDNLMDIIVSAAGYSAAELYCHASAATRAEAFLKTIGKWEE
jgi:hypothetical protein